MKQFTIELLGGRLRFLVECENTPADLVRVQIWLMGVRHEPDDKIRVGLGYKRHNQADFLWIQHPGDELAYNVQTHILGYKND